MGKLSRLAQLRPPDWDAVKRQWDANIHSTQGKVFAGLTSLTALAMASAFLRPGNAIVRFFGSYGLTYFFPALNLLQLRRWNRTLAFPAALIYTAIAVVTLLNCFSFGNLLTSLLLSLSFIFAAASDRISFVFKWNSPFDHLGIVGLSLLLCLAVNFLSVFFGFGVFIGIFIIMALFIVTRGIFGRRRYRRWF